MFVPYDVALQLERMTSAFHINRLSSKYLRQCEIYTPSKVSCGTYLFFTISKIFTISKFIGRRSGAAARTVHIAIYN